MTIPLTDQRLDEIAARAESVREYIDLPDDTDGLAADDVPALIAEIRRLRAQATAGWTGLRDRIRRAFCEAEGFAWDSDMLEPDEYGEVADAVLAVLPAPADELAATTCSAQYHGHDEARICIRAAQHLGKAHTDEHGFHWSDTVAVYPVADGTWRTGPSLRERLRRVAAEEQPATETPWPSVTDFALEVWEAETWIECHSKRKTLDEARERREAYRRRFPNARLRIIRWDKTSAVVETGLGPTAGAQQDGEATR